MRKRLKMKLEKYFDDSLYGNYEYQNWINSITLQSVDCAIKLRSLLFSIISISKSNFIRSSSLWLYSFLFSFREAFFFNFYFWLWESSLLVRNVHRRMFSLKWRSRKRKLNWFYVFFSFEESFFLSFVIFACCSVFPILFTSSCCIFGL